MSAQRLQHAKNVYFLLFYEFQPPSQTKWLVSKLIPLSIILFATVNKITSCSYDPKE